MSRSRIRSSGRGYDRHRSHRMDPHDPYRSATHREEARALCRACPDRVQKIYRSDEL
jgi:hypothetical protein